jgi:UDP-GlcNAc:undecaprenyl-phosphate GlcNAc-1-phosphate transferase
MIIYAVFSLFIIVAFLVADRTDFQFKRYPLIDSIFKDGLRRIRDDRWIIRVSFAFSKTIIPLLLLLSCLLPARVPRYVSLIADCFSLLILAVWMFAKHRMDFWLRFVLYLTVPLLLYLIEEGRAAWISATMFNVYYMSFGIVAFFVLLTMKYSRRTKGFRMTTMDFLVIFIAVAVPNLPDQSIQSHHLGLLAVEIIVMLFGYEVLLAELREKTSLTAFTLIALIVIGIRGSLGF